MDIAKQAFNGLFPEKNPDDFEFSVKYTDKFKPYNGNVRYTKDFVRGKRILFSLSKKWKKVDRDILIGFLQELLLKVFKRKKSTINIDLYNIFLKNVHIAVDKTKADKELEESFNRINERYFCGVIEQPNLVWGKNSVRKLGSYEYGSDTITISNIFKGNQRLIDYIMYHEILHKKHKFRNENGRNYYHTGNFKREEKRFENSEVLEKEIRSFIRKKRLERALLRF